MQHRVLIGFSFLLAACGGGIGGGADAGSDDAGADQDAGETQTPNFEVGVDATSEVAELTDRYVSFAVDIDRMLVNADGLVGIDFTDARLRALTKNLGPTLMRIGGTKADFAYYDLDDEIVGDPPDPYDQTLRGSIWSEACDFANELGLEIAFTLNAGAGSRDAAGAWTPDVARAFIERSIADDCPVIAWELGNEVSAYSGIGEDEVSPEQYAADFITARALIEELTPDAMLAGPASAYFPVWGEATLIDRFLPRFVQDAGDAIQVITWHYYPTQPAEAPLVSRRASLEALLEPDNLDEVVTWAQQVEDAGAADAPGAQIWLGETASVLDGGLEGLSDQFGAGLWWLDQLGILASRGEQVVARQSLTGGHYHLIDADSLEPRPDYFNSILFRTFMGHRVLPRPTTTESTPTTFDETRIRAYAHCTPGHPGSVTVLALNLSQYGPATLTFPGMGDARELYLATATTPDWLGTEIDLNGTVLAVGEDGSLPELVPVMTTDPIELPPVSYAFVVLPEAAAAACE